MYFDLSCFTGLNILFVEENVKCQQTCLTVKMPLHKSEESLRWSADIEYGQRPIFRGLMSAFIGEWDCRGLSSNIRDLRWCPQNLIYLCIEMRRILTEPQLSGIKR